MVLPTNSCHLTKGKVGNDPVKTNSLPILPGRLAAKATINGKPIMPKRRYYYLIIRFGLTFTFRDGRVRASFPVEFFMRLALLFQLVFCAAFSQARVTHAQSADPYLNWVLSQAAEMRKAAPLPVDKLREKLSLALGLTTPLAQDLKPRLEGTIQADGFRIEKVTFQTFPGVRMPGLLYLPQKPGKYPAVLNVHGHWKGAKQDPVLQARCAALARAGLVALAVDALGAGERGVGRPLGEYHGAMTGAGLLPVGLPLCGAQMLENTQALNYLQSRPEVDAENLGVTGASGGGNQTMYLAAWDKRVKAAVPVCSVGNYQAYLGAACCMCEVVPGALSFTEEDGLLAMVAPRPLMVISASRDARQFSPEEARKSIESARKVYSKLGAEKSLVHKVFESGHDYSRPMREAMVGFMRLHLQAGGDGSPYPEAEYKPFPPEDLRCFPEAAKPEGWITVPQLAQRLGREALDKNPLPMEVNSSWQLAKTIALDKLLAIPAQPEIHETGHLSEDGKTLDWQPEPGLKLQASIRSSNGAGTAVLLLHPDGKDAAQKHPIFRELGLAGATVVTANLRAQARPADAIGPAPDHNSAEWALWLGKPMLGQWTTDVRTLAEEIVQSGAAGRIGRIRVVGIGSMGVVALTAAANSPRISKVATHQMPLSLLSDRPFTNQRLGLFAPRLLLDVGDIPHLIAMLGSERVAISGAVDSQGLDLPADAILKAVGSVNSKVIIPAQPDMAKVVSKAALQDN